MKPYYEDAVAVIYHGDCREVREWLAADVLVTDPPYGIAHDSGWLSRPIVGDGDTRARDDALAMWGEKPALVFGHWSRPHPARTKTMLIWDKGDWPGMGDLDLPWGPSTEEIYVLGSGFVGRRAGTVIRVDRVMGNPLHANEKPVGLLARLLRCCPEGIVADCFMGSGSTLVAAKQLQRRAIGVEIDERYCEIAAQRLSQETLGLTLL